VQGEGTNLGTPSVFVRLGICNLHCWYCDTKYTWLFNDKLLENVRSDMRRLGLEENAYPTDLRVYDQSKEVRAISVEEVESRIRALMINHVVVTGGEPMLQQSQLALLLRKLKKVVGWEQFYFEVETNGTVKPSDELLELVDQWNVSPKLESSGNSRFSREKKDALRAFACLSNSFFKFVVSGQSFDRDLREIETFASTSGISPAKILLMAEGTEATLLKERTATLSKVCASRGYRVTPRLQILLWGNQRGT
jgi:7-carboxy-7-deazaguanine synthase